jgi:hypothetical protein
MTRTKKIFLGLGVVALLAIVAVWLVLTGETFRAYVQQELVLRLEKATGGKVAMRSLEIQFLPLRVVISDLSIAKESSPETPVLTIRTVETYPHFSSFLGMPSLGALTLREPQFRVEVGPDGSTNIPQPPRSSEAQDLFRLLVEKLDVENGVLRYNQRQKTFSTQLQGVLLSVRYLPLEGRYQGRFRHEKGILQVGRNVWTYGLDASLSLSQVQLDFERLLLTTAQSKVEAKGVVKNFRDPAGEFTYQGNVSLAEARPLHRQLRDLQGVIQVAGTLSFSDGGWKSAGTLNGLGLSMNTVRVERFSSQFEFSPELLRLTGTQMTGLHGKAEGQFSVESPFAVRRYKADFRLGKIGLLDLSLLAGLERVRFAGELSGTLKAAWLDEGRPARSVHPSSSDRPARADVPRRLRFWHSRQAGAGRDCRPGARDDDLAGPAPGRHVRSRTSAGHAHVHVHVSRQSPTATVTATARPTTRSPHPPSPRRAARAARR